MKRTLLPLLMFTTATLAEPLVEAPMPPAMVAIPAPDLPEKRSLSEELNQGSTPSSATTRKGGYSLGTQGGRAYLEPRQDDLHPDMLTPQWELFNWKSRPAQ